VIEVFDLVSLIAALRTSNLYSYLYSKEQLGKLDINAQEHGVLLTEAPLNPKQNREEACKVTTYLHLVLFALRRTSRLLQSIY
jgi:hypothetical protein